MKNIYLTFLLLFFLVNLTFAQNKIDSLKSLLVKTKEDTLKAKLLLKIGREYLYSDSLNSYKSYKQAFELSRKISFGLGIAHSLRGLGLFYETYSDYSLAIDYYRKALNAFAELKNKKYESSCLNDLGIIHFYRGDFTKALRYFQQSVIIDQLLGDEMGVSASYINIGSIHENLKHTSIAENYYLKALKIKQKFSDKSGISSCYLNIGNIALIELNYSKAITYYEKALELKQELNDKRGMSKCYNNIGITYSKLKNNFNALHFYQKALDLFVKIDDKQNITGCLLNISNTYLDMKQPNEALAIVEKSCKLAEQINSNIDLLNAYGLEAKIHAFKNDFSKAYYYQLCYDTIKNKVNNDEDIRAQQEMEAAFQNKQKEKEIELQKEQIARKEAEIGKQTTQKYAIGLGLCLASLLLIAISFAFTQKKKANIILNRQKAEIQEKNEELLQQNEEIAAQRDEIELQKLLVDNQNKEITDSIHYAKRIQTAIFPPKQITLENFPEHFFLFKPRDIVSGDFYWTTLINGEDNSKGYLIAAAVDCTGHGVPGAFMSMLGISFLSEIVNKSQIQTIKADQILDQLRIKVITALHQTGKEGEQKDGMDIALCILNLDNLQLQFAGAYSPLYIVRNIEEQKNNITTTETRLIELKADKMPIGIYYRNTPVFTNHEIQLQPNDCIYIFSDGYVDQFSAQNGKKLKSSLFKKILIEVNSFCMDEQKTILDEKFENWKGASRQVDDVLVIGFRV